MNCEKLFAKASRAMVRRISLLNASLPAALLVIVSGEFPVLSIVCNLIVSSLIILMIPDTFNDILFAVWAALAVFLLSFMAVIIAAVAGGGMMYSCSYPVIGLLLLTLCLTRRVYMMMHTPAYLVMRISGWEIMLCLMKVCYLLMFMLVSSVAIMMAASGNGGYVTGTLLPLLMASGYYAVLYVRSLTSGPIISFSSAGVPKGERNVELSACLPQTSRSDYKLMYNRLCHLMAEKKPYLDPYYSLDNLVKAMMSNKSYVSRLIHTCTGLNFSQLINRYRVDYAISLFRNNLDLKVKDLADMSGFHSQVTFNMAFKLFYDVTPGIWCKEYRDSLRIEKSPSSQEERELSLPKGFSVPGG